MDATLEHFETLKAAHRDVAGRTRALADGCGRLVAEEEALAEFAGTPAALKFKQQMQILPSALKSKHRRQFCVCKTVCMFIHELMGSVWGAWCSARMTQTGY